MTERRYHTRSGMGDDINPIRNPTKRELEQAMTLTLQDALRFTVMQGKPITEAMVEPYADALAALRNGGCTLEFERRTLDRLMETGWELTLPFEKTAVAEWLRGEEKN